MAGCQKTKQKQNKTIGGVAEGRGTRVAVSKLGGGSFNLNSTTDTGGHSTSASEERQRARWGCSGLQPSWAQGAARGPRLCARAAAPAAAFNLDFSLLASGTGGKPVQMGVLSDDSPPAPALSRRCRTLLGGPRHVAGEGAPRTVRTRPWCPLPRPRSDCGARRWALPRGGREQW